jgi:hypothetical protein
MRRRQHAYRLAAHDRRIAVALLVSVLLHAPLFLPTGIFSIGPARESSAPGELRIELQGMPEAEPGEELPGESPPPEQALVATVAEPLDESVDEAVDASVAERVDASEPTEELQASATPGPDTLSASTTPASGFHEEIIGDVATLDEVANVPLSAVEIPSLEDARAEVTTGVPTQPLAENLATIAPAEVRQLERVLEDEARDLLASSSTQRQLDFTTNDHAYSAVLTREPAADGMGVERVTVDLTTQQGGQRVQTSLQLKRLAFSHFTQLVDRWDSQVQLHDDEIAGRFHSNSIINLTYDRQVAPRLLGLVTTARYVRIAGEKGFRPRSKIFIGGLKTNTPRIRLPPIAIPVNEGAVEGADVHVLAGDTLIVFRAEGTYEAVDLASQGRTTRTIASGRPLYIVGSGKPELRVRGVVNGSVTVYSPHDIVVQGHLTYASDPRSEDADDYLGLVSDRNVEIAKADVTGPGDLHVHAAIYARNRFVVRNVSARGGGTMFVYGSITAGSMSETEPRYGTRTDFDPRFERVRPPGFPETDRYEVEGWNERWHLAEGDSAGMP